MAKFYAVCYDPMAAAGREWDVSTVSAPNHAAAFEFLEESTNFPVRCVAMTKRDARKIIGELQRAIREE